jgi:hypothetical protein
MLINDRKCAPRINRHSCFIYGTISRVASGAVRGDVMTLVPNGDYSGDDLSNERHGGNALDADFKNANLHRANLSSVKNLTIGQIRQARCSFGAIVPVAFRLFTSKRCKCGKER